jgi:SAM-dependent methyltransferase
MLWELRQKVGDYIKDPKAAKRQIQEDVFQAKKAVDLDGDRDVEWSWVAARIPESVGKVLDFGAGNSFLSMIAALKGNDVTAVDMGPCNWLYDHKSVKYVQGDLVKMDFAKETFDLVINCSVIEHVGLAGRYGYDEDTGDGDMECMDYIKKITKSGGRMLLTLPIGKDAVFAPMHRVYGNERLPKLLNGWSIESEEYWVKPGINKWQETDKKTALDAQVNEKLYGIGLLVLQVFH